MPVFLADASGGSQITFEGRYTPNTPLPRYQNKKAELPNLDGSEIIQDFGWGPGRIRVQLRWLPYSMVESIRALFQSKTGTARNQVRFSNGKATWLCRWDGDFEPQRVDRVRTELYDLELSLVIRSVVS